MKEFDMSKTKKISKKNEKKEKENLLSKILFFHGVPYLIIIILGLSLYYQTLEYGFTYFDDHYIFPNANAFHGLQAANEIFKRDAILSTSGIEFYRPFQGLSFLVDASISGDKAFGYHLSSLIIHILACMSIFYLFTTLKLNKYLSLVLTGIFTVHPLFTQSVAWVPARGDLLIGLFGSLSFSFFIRYYQKYNPIYFALHIITFFIAVFSKETTLLFPIIFGLYFIFIINKDKKLKTFNLSNILLIFFWGFIAVLYVYLRSTVTRADVSTSNLSSATFFSHLLTFPEFLAKIIIPFNLSGMPEYSLIPSVLGIILLIGCGLSFFIFRKTPNYLGLIALIWFFLFAAITMIYRHPHGNDAYAYLEHRIYLPAIGILIFILSLPFNKKFITNLSLGCLGIILIFFYFANERTKYYKDPITFYDYVINSGTHVALAYNNRGYYDELIGKNDDAFKDFDMAARLKPDYALAISNRGNQKNRRGDKQGAMDDYNLALKYDANLAEAYNNRGYMYYAAKKYPLAVADFEKALSIKKEFVVSLMNMGVTKYYMNDLAGACTAWYRAAELGSAQAKNFIKEYCSQK